MPFAAVRVLLSVLLSVLSVATSTGRLGNSLTVSLKRRDFHGDALSVQGHKMAYYGDVAVGTPPQVFSVVYDTGSGNLIVPGSSCKNLACTKHDRFAASKSSTMRFVNCDGAEEGQKAPEDEVTITFGTGSITGTCARDSVCIGSICAPGDFIASTEESDTPFADFSFDGVLGLALPSMAQSPNFSLMGQLAQRGALKRPLFSVFLSEVEGEISEVTFGDIVDEHMASELFWVPVTGTAGYWEVRIEDITLDGKKQGICKDCKVAVDTGTSQLAGPTEIIQDLTRALGARSDCSNYKSLPKLGFIIGGRILSLAPSEYMTNSEGTYCDVSLMSIDVPPPRGPLFVFGIPFLTKYYSVYDHGTNRVGFAVARHKGQQPEVLVEVDPPAAEERRPPTPSFLATRKAEGAVARVTLRESSK